MKIKFNDEKSIKQKPHFVKSGGFVWSDFKLGCPELAELHRVPGERDLR